MPKEFLQSDPVAVEACNATWASSRTSKVGKRPKMVGVTLETTSSLFSHVSGVLIM